MRIGVISDTHIHDRTEEIPKKILDDFKSVDMVIHTGDLVDLSVLEKLQSVCPKVKAVWGNMDPEEVRKKLHQKEIIKVGKHKIGIMHGYGPPYNLIEVVKNEFKSDKPDIILFGHSHAPLNEKKEGVLFFNPGSATDKMFAPYNSYGIIEINDEIEAKIIKL
jgi:putative phosphoesterase